MPEILIVEDSISVRAELYSILKEYAVCHLAENGKEAVEKVKNQYSLGKPLDLIVMDIVMPVMDGIEAIKEIRKLEEDKGVQSDKKCKMLIVTTVKDPEKIVFVQYECGADGYIIKPFNRKTVLQTISNVGLELV